MLPPTAAHSSPASLASYLPLLNNTFLFHWTDLAGRTVDCIALSTQSVPLQGSRARFKQSPATSNEAIGWHEMTARENVCRRLHLCLLKKAAHFATDMRFPKTARPDFLRLSSMDTHILFRLFSPDAARQFIGALEMLTFR